METFYALLVRGYLGWEHLSVEQAEGPELEWLQGPYPEARIHTS
jgi:hypothetical protein